MNPSNTFVINLDKDTERLKKVSKLLDNNFTRFPAIKGRDLSPEEIKKETNFFCRYFLCNHAIVGCALSHLRLWERLIHDPDHDFYVIFEDDLVKVNKDGIDTIINNHLDKLEYDYINLYCFSSFNYKCRHWVNDPDIKICKTISPFSTAGYIIHKKGAENLVHKFKDNIVYHIDFSIALFQYLCKDFKLYRATPDLILPSFTESNITNFIGSPLNYLLELMLGKGIRWILSVPVVIINMKYQVPLYFFLVLILLFLSRKYKYLFLFFYMELLFCVIPILH